jgi:hypothetical protein
VPHRHRLCSNNQQRCALQFDATGKFGASARQVNARGTNELPAILASSIPMHFSHISSSCRMSAAGESRTRKMNATAECEVGSVRTGRPQRDPPLASRTYPPGVSTDPWRNWSSVLKIELSRFAADVRTPERSEYRLKAGPLEWTRHCEPTAKRRAKQSRNNTWIASSLCSSQ